MISEDSIQFPSYVRLGKWMSKARLSTHAVSIKGERSEASFPFLLAASDFPPTAQLLAYDLLSVAPTPLMRNCYMIGPCYVLDQNVLLPQGMRFNVEGFT